MNIYDKYGKRVIDIVLSLFLLIFLSPVFLVLYFMVIIKLGRPAIFKQERVGKDEKIFTLYKFRSMNQKKDREGNLLPDEERLTKFGKILRSTSLDELPELFNILKGDMSFVGPRPLLVEYLEYYNDEQKHRHDVRSGLTGLAQVKGRNLLSWEERFQLDVEYAKNVTLIGDIKIFFETIGAVFSKKRSYHIFRRNHGTL
ncbi:MAG: sugar transferase [Clostridia bacterium]|nr:sugar transferase [Clostridia bacterium]